MSREPKKRAYTNAEAGDTEAMREIADFHWHCWLKSRRPADGRAASDWYRRAANVGDLDAMKDYGDCQRMGLVGEPNEKCALEWYRRAAGRGHAASMTAIAEICYARWDECRNSADARAALDWYRRAANAGDLDGMKGYGDCLYEGLSGDTDETGALGWYHRAAEKGDGDSMFAIFEHHLSWEEPEPDDVTRGITWLKRAAELECVAALVELGRRMIWGVDVPPEPKRGITLLCRALELDPDDAEAMLYLGITHEEAIGTATDLKQALGYYRRAAKLGSANAMFALARCYQRGIGIRSSPTMARRWYEKADQGGHERAKTALRLL